MNGQLPPIDSEIRDQLARRSAGRMPESLLADVLTAVDSAPARRGGDGWPRLIWPVPRLAVAGMGIALVAILAVAIVFPAVRTGPAAPPASYPADRALTTAELAAVMAGPALATNTALVAAVTIDARNDVCPMNRYPTVGVVEGMASQVCVMGATLAAQIQVPKATRTFAFRYLGPGYLGLLGEITPASVKPAFRVADNWPGSGTFLVVGWLGADPYPCPTYLATLGGDPLDPDGQDQCESNWLADDPSAARPASSAGGVLPPVGGKIVQAGGMRVIDAVPNDVPVLGTYVVRGGRVLAKVANLSLPAPSPEAATPSPTAGPSAAPPETPVAEPSGVLSPAPLGLLGPGNRPLTEAEFAAVWAADPAHLGGRIAIVKGPVPTGFECSPVGAADAAGPSPGCRIAVLDGQIAADGHYWAIQVGSNGKLAIVGEVTVFQAGYVFTLDQALESSRNSGAGLRVVDAWLGWEPSLACDMPGGDPLCQAGAMWSRLTSAPLAQPNADAATQLDVQLGAYQIFGSKDLEARPIHGLYLVQSGGSSATILARLEVAAP
jgi:hypothetical protein